MQITFYEAGANLYLKSGETLPKDVLDACLNADAVLLAKIGLPNVRKSDGTEVQPEMMMGLRRALNVYAAVRLVKLYPGVTGPLRTADAGSDGDVCRQSERVSEFRLLSKGILGGCGGVPSCGKSSGTILFARTFVAATSHGTSVDSQSTFFETQKSHFGRCPVRTTWLAMRTTQTANSVSLKRAQSI